MSEETKIQCPACTAELPAETVECPWCGRLLTPKVEAAHAETAFVPQEETIEPEATLLPAEPEPTLLPEEPNQPAEPEAPSFIVAEPGLTELPMPPGQSSSNSLKVMGIIMTIFSFLALGFFITQVLNGNLPRLVLLLPIFGLLIGLISVAVGQRR